ncbi:NADH-ubiquinone oxidoreductase subunit A [Pestalotiopsis fici W106-1]|uniref:NADH-ubiquinone oxidoreductase subunit A n=1 Tax=Pestalotiopsis fici (strain W106-1 / CGMCC3.15140) TaxID=1229662 RepID=W3XAR6_PESFW|nr:NADH-ubiquinone oxidoreductase subunit A [Pestalotiopsis fici W106-1]ETS82231.1 NADH-ubiquinone oxidoreductase subunit A [Pestalotiopsis fici W106-1]
MASKAVAKAAGGVMSVSQKQTLQSTGIWDRIRRVLAVDPNRSSGVPLNPYYRNPNPGSNDPLAYDDPVTIPAGDIADNPYWKRDARRNYPKLSFVNQADAVALLGVGSAASPKQELIGEAGEQALVAAKSEGVEGGLAKFFEAKGPATAQELLVNGLPPLPSGQALKKDGSGLWEAKQYELVEEQTYPDDAYPCRVFK